MGALVWVLLARMIVAGAFLLALLAVPPASVATGQGSDCSEFWRLTAPQVPYFPPGAIGLTRDNTYSCYLQAMGERSLLDLRARHVAETYRLLVLPPWQHPMLVRLVIRPNGTGALSVRVSKSQREASTLTIDRVQSVSKAETQTFLQLLAEAHFWSMPSHIWLSYDHVIVKEMDGVDWVLEGAGTHRYHVVTRNSPGMGPYWALVSYLFRELANLRMPPVPIVPKKR